MVSIVVPVPSERVEVSIRTTLGHFHNKRQLGRGDPNVEVRGSLAGDHPQSEEDRFA